VVEIDSESSLLETAEQSGIKINNACRQGACGACKVRVQGQVEHEGVASALTEDDRKKGYVLSCIAYAKGATSVEA
jgi:ferredoxin